MPSLEARGKFNLALSPANKFSRLCRRWSATSLTPCAKDRGNAMMDLMRKILDRFDVKRVVKAEPKDKA